MNDNPNRDPNRMTFEEIIAPDYEPETFAQCVGEALRRHQRYRIDNQLGQPSDQSTRELSTKLMLELAERDPSQRLEILEYLTKMEQELAEQIEPMHKKWGKFALYLASMIGFLILVMMAIGSVVN